MLRIRLLQSYWTLTLGEKLASLTITVPSDDFDTGIRIQGHCWVVVRNHILNLSVRKSSGARCTWARITACTETTAWGGTTRVREGERASVESEAHGHFARIYIIPPHEIHCLVNFC